MRISRFGSMLVFGFFCTKHRECNTEVRNVKLLTVVKQSLALMETHDSE